jgi:anti-sigma regulatory factor (Ser/Thr protein kinase)
VTDRRSAHRHVVDLEHCAQTPSVARAAAAELVAELHLEPIGDDVALVVSELVTNAVRHASPPVRLELSADDRRVTVGVADGSDRTPVARAADDDCEGGRGMPLVDLLAAESGVSPHPPGKTVWAALRRQ